MEANVFSYFLAIGAGLTAGVAIVLLPSYWVFNKVRGGKANAKQPVWK